MPAKPDRGGKVNGLAGAVKHTLCSVLSAMGSLPGTRSGDRGHSEPFGVAGFRARS
jgi:hypothetical protein